MCKVGGDPVYLSNLNERFFAIYFFQEKTFQNTASDLQSGKIKIKHVRNITHSTQTAPS